MPKISLISVVIVCASLLATSNRTFAGDEIYSIGFRGNVMAEDGEPANDLLGFGVYGKYRLEDGWAIGVGVDLYIYDFENPSEFIGLQGTEIIDAEATNTQVNIWGEKSYQWGDATKWYWGAGFGVAIVSIDPASGDLISGGTYDITTNTSSELVTMAMLGMTWRFGQYIETDVSASVEHHSGKWEVTDKVSGITKTLDGYTPIGLRLGVNYYF